MHKIIQGNDVAVNWTIKVKDTIVDFTNLTTAVYICDSIGKRIVTNITKDSNGLHFKFLANNQFAGPVRLEAVWTTNTSGNKRVVADKVIEYINDPENVDDEIDTIDIVTTAYKSVITYS